MYEYKFIFKIYKYKGLEEVCAGFNCDVLYKKKVIGIIFKKPEEFFYNTLVKKYIPVEKRENNCNWDWVHLSFRSDKFEEMKKFFIDNKKSILEMYNIEKIIGERNDKD